MNDQLKELEEFVLSLRAITQMLEKKFAGFASLSSPYALQVSGYDKILAKIAEMRENK